jgi:hypothetical protein
MNVTWVLLAWTVAACQLRLPVMQHQVFGAETIAAFVVVVMLPIMQAGRIAQVARQTISALKRANAGHGGAESKAA